MCISVIKAVKPTWRMRETCFELGVVEPWSFCWMTDTKLERVRGHWLAVLGVLVGLLWKEAILNRSIR